MEWQQRDSTSEFALFTAAGTNQLNELKVDQHWQQSATGATASACEGSRALETLMRLCGRRMQPSRKHLENGRVAREALTQKEIRGEA